ncbi:MAG: hypothetical protein H0X41_07670 [Chitinophagaceae bacterium]|nr:hypothetical protein [Chitinophagaceae bacterium]
MKKLLIVLVTMGLAWGASAQKIVRGGGYHFRGPRVIVGAGAGFSPFYPYYGPYSAFGYPYGGYGYRYSSRPSRLELQVQDIRLDYADRIRSVKMDHALKGRERRQTIRQLKNERDRAIVDAKRNYYYNRSSAGRTPNGNSNNNN